MTTFQPPDERVAAALEAAVIPPARCGSERTRRLSTGERTLYRWILERFADATSPDAGAVAEHAAALGLNTGDALATLAREDLVHADERGAIVVAYPFSGRPRGHRVLIDNSRTVQAMCALDALGIAAMLDQPIEVTSCDPSSGAEVWVRVHPGEGAWWEPRSAVVLAGSSCCDGPSYHGCCDVLNFFESAGRAAAYLDHHADVNGLPISITEAIEAGRAIFGDIFKEA